MKNKIKNIVAKILIAVIILNVLPAFDVAKLYSIYAASPRAGSGTEASPYIITSAAEVDGIRNNLNTGVYYQLDRNIDMSSMPNFVPIGTKASPFRGRINGAGFTISSLKVDAAGKDEAGFIGSNQGVIQNIGFANLQVKGKDFVGLVGQNDGEGIIQNVHTSGSVAGQNSVSGIAGMNYGTISNTYTNCNVYGNNNVGGIAGINSNIIKSVYTVGNVRANKNPGSIVGNDAFGGEITNAYSNVAPLVGLKEPEAVETNVAVKTLAELKNISNYTGFVGSEWKIQPTYPYATQAGVNKVIYNNDVEYSGGDGTVIAPYKITMKEELQKIDKNLNSNYQIENNLNMIGIDFTPIGTEARYFTGSINGNNKTVSNLNINKPGQNKVAFVAYNDGIIEKIGFPAINVVGEKDVAGVVAYNGGSVSEVFTTGKVTGNGNVSGIIGTNEAKGNVKNVYSLASVRGQVNVAGIIGHNLGTVEAIYARGPKGDTTTNVANLIGQNGPTAKVTRAYHSSNSGIAQNKGIGQEEAASTDMYAKTDLELQQQTTYKSWNFTDVWAIDTNINSGFPYFKSIVNVEVISITLPETSKNLEKTNTYQLVPTIFPANATVKDVIYETSNPAVATVSSTGLVTAVENGSAVIKVTSTGSGLSATCDVLVAAKTNGVTLKDENGNIIANTGSIALDSLTSLGLEVITDPVDAQVACEWLSDKTSLVRVEGTGRNIRIYAEDVIGASTEATYLNLTVTPTNGAPVTLSVLVSVTQRVKTLTTDKETYTLDLTNAGQDVSNIVATILPANAVDKSLSFTVADPTVVKLEAGANAETKKITGLKPGQTTVTIQTTDPDLKPAISKTVNVIVKKEPKTVEILNNGAAIKDKQLLLCEKINGKITHKFNAEDTTDNEVVWSIDNLNVATIDSFGVLTPVRSADNTVVEGKANLTVTTTSSAYAKISDTVNITTEQHVETITMNRRAYTRQAGNVVETGKFFVKTVGPKEDITKQKIKWTSANENIVTVTNDSDPGTPRGAELTFKNNAGSTTITATIIDGVHDNVSVTSEVHVTRLPNTVELDKPDQMEVYVSDQAPTRITAKVTPGDVTNKNVSWEVKAYDPDGTLLNTNDRATETPGTDASGLPYLELTPKIKGKLEIRVRAAGLSTVYKDIVVEIKERPASVALDSVNLTLATEDITVASTVYKKDHKLTATIYPAESSYKGVVYESLDPAIATVDALGNVSALKGGKTKIKVSSDKFPDVNIYCDVDIKQVPVGIELWDKDNKENVTNKQIEIYNDDPYKINHKFLPVDNSIFTDFATVTYKSSNELVAAVTAEGVITVKPNIKESCIVTVTSLNNKTATVTVVPKQKVTSVKLDKQTAAIKSDETLQIYAEVTPTFAYNKQVTWTTSDAAVATVDQNGLVTAVAPSLTPVTITATTVDGNFKDTCAVTVSQAATGVVIKNATTDVEITAQVDMFNTETLPLKAVVTPSGVAQDVTWSSDNLSIANVSALGVVTFVETGAGIVHITATTANGKVASIAVNAKRHVSSVSIPNKVIEIQKGETATVLATVLPENASNKAVTWSSSDPSIADIDGDGIVRGILGGTVTVTAISAENSAYTDTATVKVIAKPASMSVAEPSVVTYIGDTPKNLKYTILPVDTTDKTVTYSIDRLNIMEAKDGATAETVDISGVAVGNAVLTLTSKADSKITASCNVEVRRHPTSIKLDKTNIEIYTESIEYIKETVLEADSFDKSVTWTSSDPLVVSVDTQGKITAGTNIGTSTITATTVDGNLAASCLVTVKKLPEGVSLDK
ncbi:MAG: Ig-like domain-containing protein, partial [Clostridia bacterium]